MCACYETLVKDYSALIAPYSNGASIIVNVAESLVAIGKGMIVVERLIGQVAGVLGDDDILHGVLHRLSLIMNLRLFCIFFLQK